MNFKINFKIFSPEIQSKLDLKPQKCDSMIILKQNHTNIVVNTPNIETIGDASFTTRYNTSCTVLTADCLPLLLIDQHLGKVGAIHAGWKGLADGIIENTLGEFSTKTKIILCPSITYDVYEVGEELISRFERFADCYTKKENNKFLLDLRKIAKHIINNFGITNILDFNICTYQNNWLPSYRRSKDKMRLASTVWMEQ